MSKELDLLEAARKGDPQALGQVFDLYAPAIYRYAVRLSQDPGEADQIVGDVFAQLLEQLSAGRGPKTNLRSYLYQIAYHVLIDRVRSAAHTSSLEEALNVPDGVASVGSQVEEQELLRDLEHAVQHGLTPDQRHVVILRFVEGFNLQETAEITGKRVNAVSVLQNRAVARLRQLLETKSEVGQ